MASTTHSSDDETFNNLITLYQRIMDKDDRNLAPPKIETITHTKKIILSEISGLHVFRGYRKRHVALNGLNELNMFIICITFLQKGIFILRCLHSLNK